MQSADQENTCSYRESMEVILAVRIIQRSWLPGFQPVRVSPAMTVARVGEAELVSESLPTEEELPDEEPHGPGPRSRRMPSRISARVGPESDDESTDIGPGCRWTSPQDSTEPRSSPSWCPTGGGAGHPGVHLRLSSRDRDRCRPLWSSRPPCTDFDLGLLLLAAAWLAVAWLARWLMAAALPAATAASVALA